MVAFTFVGCEDFIEGDAINSDPNNPTAVPVTAQLPAFQIALADNVGGDFSRFNSMLVQQVEGVARQWTAFNQYTGLTPNRFDAAWQNTYENTLNEIQVAKNSSQENGYNHFLGILNIMEAYTLMIATDVWDDMPYTDALQGVGALNPTFDTQASIYTSIYSFLEEGISLLNGPPGSLSPGGEDVFYAGNIEAWIKAAHAIKARGLLKDKDFAGAISEAQQAFANASDNLSFQYPNANAAGGWFRFNRDRTGDLEFHPSMRNLMTNLNDMDRLAVMDQIFDTDHTYLIPNFLQELISYREMQFIIAEADQRISGGTQTGYDAYLEGIRASFARLGLGDTAFETYIAQNDINPGVGNLSLETIMTQKYIAMFLQPEVYSDWRRTGFPTLSPVSGTAIPVRWNYPATELLFNTNAPAEGAVDIFTNRVGWNR